MLTSNTRSREVITINIKTFIFEKNYILLNKNKKFELLY
jgi:hypothetical protein